jgi:hypothetical protein
MKYVSEAEKQYRKCDRGVNSKRRSDSGVIDDPNCEPRGAEQMSCPPIFQYPDREVVESNFGVGEVSGRNFQKIWYSGTCVPGQDECKQFTWNK